MDDSQVLINILNDMKTNLQVIMRLAQSNGSYQSVEDRFYNWIQNPVPLESLEGEPVDNETVRFVNRFVDVLTAKIAQRETVDGSRLRRAQLQSDNSKAEAKLAQLEISVKQAEASRLAERQLKLDLIKDLELRIEQIRHKTAIALQLAKECGEAARREWDAHHQKPMGEKRLQLEMLGTRLTIMVRENAAIEEQLTKCREEHKSELESLRAKMEEDIRQRQAEVDRLKQDLSADEDELRELEEELAAISVEYDEIMAKRHKEAEEELRLRMEEKKRERAAIKIQQWFRFYLFRTMRARRRRNKKLARSRKSTKELKYPTPPSRSKTSTPAPPTRPESRAEEPAPPVAVLVSRKSANLRQRTSALPSSVVSSDVMSGDGNVTEPITTIRRPSSAEKEPPKKTSKRQTPAIRSIVVKKNGGERGAGPTSKNAVQTETKQPVVNNMTRSSQTDNRVPKSKQQYR